jgi:hypothetical protein
MIQEGMQRLLFTMQAAANQRRGCFLLGLTLLLISSCQLECCVSMCVFVNCILWQKRFVLV